MNPRTLGRTPMIAGLAALALTLAACGGGEAPATDEAPAPGDSSSADPSDGAEEPQSGSIEIDGSSTVFPLTTAIAEEYAAEQPDVIVNVGESGTGGGFERFCDTGDTQISNASRPIKEEEAALCEQNGIEFTEVRIGTDALTMVTNIDTEFVTCLTTEEIISIWGPDGATSWDQVNPEFPAEELQVFAPGTDSGTYDFFNETILATADPPIEAPRQDYSASEDDNVIAQGIIGTPGSWGYFGFAYFQENQDTLKAIEYDAGEGCVAPSVETAQDESYKLTRPLFFYVRNDALAEPLVADFVTYYVDTVNDVIESVGYIPEPDEVLAEAKATLEAAIESAG